MNDTTTRTITAYLDDLGRMLAHVDPAERADVLGGVREHLDASLAELGHEPSDQEVAAILAQLGTPEDVARAASVPGAPRTPLPDAVAPSPRALTGTWVAPVVFGLALVGILGAPLVVPGMLWLVAAVLLGSSPLWTVSEKVWGIVSGFLAGAALLGAASVFLFVSSTCVTTSAVTMLEGSDGNGAPVVEEVSSTCAAAGANGGGIVLAVLLGAVVLAALVYQGVLLRRGNARASAGTTADA